MPYSLDLLKEIGMTQKDFALWLGLNPTTISNWDEWPRYAIIILEQKAELKDYEILKGAIGRMR